mgnify:FL=1
MIIYNKLKQRYIEFSKHPLVENPVYAIARYLIVNVLFIFQVFNLKVKWVNNLKYYLSNEDSSMKENYYCHIGNFDDSLFILNYINPDETFVDVGANVGHFTLLTNGLIGAKTISIEPVKKTFARLVANINLNKLSNVIAHNIAISSSNEYLKIINHRGELNKVSCENEKKYEIVRALTLDQLLMKEDNVSLVKIDVEGYEKYILKGAKKTLSNKNLNIIIIELNGLNNYYKYNELDVINILIENNFRPFRFIPNEKKLYPLSNKNSLAHNTLFIRNINLAKERLSKRIISIDKSNIYIC